jgi:hypothetical protein
MGGSTQSDVKTTTQQLTPEQQGLVSLAYPQYQQFAASNPTLPGASGVAPFDPSQIAGQNAILGTTGIGGPGTQTGGTMSGTLRPAVMPGMAETGGGGPSTVQGERMSAGGPDGAGASPSMADIVGTAGGTNRYLSSGAFLDPGSNPYVQNAIKAATDPIYNQLRESVIPGQQATGAAGAGANFGGSRQGIAEGLSTQGAQRAAGQAGANIMNTALGQGLNATLQAIGQSPSQAMAQTIPGMVASGVGDVRQQQAQNVLDAQNQATMFAQMLPLLKAQMLTQGAAGLPGGSTQAVGTSNTEANPFSQIIGGASAAGGLMGGLGKLLPFFMM